jgi:hypothetical protein
MQVSWSGTAIFAAFCLLLWVALANPTWRPFAEAAAAVLVLGGFAGIVIPEAQEVSGRPVKGPYRMALPPASPSCGRALRIYRKRTRPSADGCPKWPKSPIDVYSVNFLTITNLSG